MAHRVQPVPWDAIETVLLDLDGTLLDLQFDNHFWFEHLPRRLAGSRGIPREVADAEVRVRIEAGRGTLAWYCLDHWGIELELDLLALTREIQHLIKVHPNVTPLLRSLRAAGKRLLLVTNGHAASLALKLERTQLAQHFDRVICAHDLGLPKEDPAFWDRLADVNAFRPAKTLLVDDNPEVLRSAKRFGIRYLLRALQPDSSHPAVTCDEFAGIVDFAELLPIANVAAR
jgi:putative hydrolase of the HAD superfamily